MGVHPLDVVHGDILADGAGPLGTSARFASRSWPHAASMSTPRLRRIVAWTPCGAEPLGEGLDPRAIAGAATESAGRVERDQVHVRAAAEAGEAARERVGLMGMVVDPVNAGVLERHPPALARGVVAGGVDHVGDRVAPVERHELAAQRVVGCVQRDRERDRQRELLEAPHPGNDADGRHGEVAGRDPDVVVEARARVEHGIDVGERFAHAHEHDVGDALRRCVLRAQHLLDDLAGTEMAFEAGLAGRAERAAHRATGL